MSLSLNFPTVSPSLNLNFAKTKSLDPRITFSRSSSATYTDSEGIVRTSPVNRPRFQHEYNSTTGQWVSRGLLIEESRTNLVQYSEYTTNSYWIKSNTTVSNEVIPGPAGVRPYDKITLNNFTSSAGWIRSTGLSDSSNTIYTVSVYLKAGTCRYAALFYQAYNSSQYGIYVDLQTGVLYSNRGSLDSQITPVGNGWYKVNIRVDSMTGGSGRYIFIVPVTVQFPTQGPSSQTDISYNSAGEYLYVWGFQHEQGLFPTSYIPTIPTFTSRASSATFYDSSGVLQTAGTNVARSNAFFPDSSGVFRPAGLLLESAGTNLLTYSEDFSNSIWTKQQATVTTNTIIAPDGTLTADKLVEDSSNNAHTINQVVTGTVNQFYSFSVYIKAGERTHVRFQIQLASDATQWEFNLTTLAVSNTYSAWTGHTAICIDVGNGWRHCILSGQSPNNGSTVLRSIIQLSNGSNNSYQGDGTSGVYIWGAQLETGSVATSYIKSMPTFTSRATSATYYDVNGFLRTAAVNEARSNAYLPDSSGVFRSIGLLYEGSSTNLFSNSNPWGGGVNVSWLPYQTAPTGAAEAYKMVESTANDIHGLAIDSGGYTAGYNQYLTVFAKADGRRYLNFWAQLGTYPGVDSPECIFDLQTGTVASINTNLSAAIFSSPTIVNVGNGWYRCGVYLNPTALANRTMYLLMSNSGSQQASSYTGDGSSGILLFGLQKESGSTATSYIPTTNATVTRSADVVSSSTTTRAADVSSSSSVTRAADSASITGTNFTNFYNSNESTLVSVGEENLHKLSSSALTISSDSSINSTVPNLIYYPKVIQYATLNNMRAYPNIVSDGLVLNLDAGVRKSYIGSGTTWRDLSGNNINGTLTNGPTYNSNNGGSIVFDGSNDFVNLNTQLTQSSSANSYTVVAAAKLSSTSTARRQIFSSDNDGYDWSFGSGDGGRFIIFSGENFYTGRLQDTNWHIFTAQWSSSFGTRLYIDNVLDISTPNIDYDNSIASTISIGRNPLGGGTEYYHGNISFVMVYNRALTATEIQQNFNATRRRFGI